MSQTNDSSNDNSPDRLNGRGDQDPSAIDDDLILDDDDFLLSSPSKQAERTDTVPLMPASVGGAIQPAPANETLDAESDRQQTPRFGTKLCPRCMQMVDGFTEQVRGTDTQYFCPSCSEVVQFRYARDYDQVSRVNLSLAGMSGHGKTMFLRGIYAYLNSLGRRWRGFRFAPLSDDDASAFNNATGESSRGGLADPSQLAERPVGFQLSGVPGAGSVHLLIYDISGEAFDTSTKLTKHAFFIPKSEVITLILSLSDMSSGHQLAFLLSRLVDAIRAKGEDPQKKSLIVVLTKGDRLKSAESLPASAESFLSNEVSSDPRDLAGLQQLSDDLQEWLLTHPDNYWNFVESAKDEFQNVRYTVISSLGSDPGMGSERTHVQINPRNVVSPLLWLFRFSLPVITLRVSSRESVFYDFCDAHQAASASSQDSVCLELESGDYQLRRPVQFDQTVEIKGAGPEYTRLIAHHGNCFVSVTGGSFAASGITFQADGTEPGLGLKISDAKIRISNCSFSGATRNRAGKTLGHGLLLDGDSSGEIEQCQFTGNEGHGLFVGGQSQLSVRKCLAEKNGIAGLIISSKSIVKSRANRIRLNRHGIYVLGNAQAELSENSCCNNTISGIWFTGNATGVVTRNTCSNDSMIADQGVQVTGIMLTGHVSADVLTNKCIRNLRDGIQADSDVASQIKGNVAKNNDRCGIGVYERAAVTLDSNHCDNNRFGIFIDKTAKKTRDMKNNDCSTNREYGLKDLRSLRWLIQ